MLNFTIMWTFRAYSIIQRNKEKFDLLQCLPHKKQELLFVYIHFLPIFFRLYSETDFGY